MKIAAPKLGNRRPGDGSLGVDSYRNRTILMWTKIKNDILKFIGRIEKKELPEGSDDRAADLVDAFNTYRIESRVVQYLVKAFLRNESNREGTAFRWPTDTIDISDEIRSVQAEKKYSKLSAENMFPYSPRYMKADLPVSDVKNGKTRRAKTVGDILKSYDLKVISQIRYFIGKSPASMDGKPGPWKDFEKHLDELSKKYSDRRIPTDEWIALKHMVPTTEHAISDKLWSDFVDESKKAIYRINKIIRSSGGDWERFLGELTSLYNQLMLRREYGKDVIHGWDRLYDLIPSTIEVRVEPEIRDIIDSMMFRANEIAGYYDGGEVASNVIKVINHAISEIQIRGEDKDELNWKSDMINLPKSIVVDIVNSIKSGKCDVTEDELKQSPEERAEHYFNQFYGMDSDDDKKEDTASKDSDSEMKMFFGTETASTDRIINPKTMRRIRYNRWLQETGRKWLNELSLIYRVNADKPEDEIESFSMNRSQVKDFLAWCWSIGIRFTVNSMPELNKFNVIRSNVADRGEKDKGSPEATSVPTGGDGLVAKVLATTSSDDQLRLDGSSVKTVLSMMRKSATTAMTASLADTDRWLDRIRKYVYGI